jgi:hypothetical protein
MSSSARDPQSLRHDRPYLETPVRTQEQSDREAVKSTIRDFSIVVGGPVYDFLLRIGVLRYNLPNAARRAVAFGAVAWLPLLMFSLMDGTAFGHKVQIPFLRDYAMYGRLLLAMPVLILAEVVIDQAIRRAVGEFLESGLVRDNDLPEFEEVLRRVQRLKDSAVPELTLLVLAFFPVFMFQQEWHAGTVSSWHTTSQGITTAGYWFAVISAPLMRFLMYRWAFRYFIWSLLLWRIGKLDLNLMPTHPDHSAGLEFLSLTQRRFGILFFALGCAFAGQMANNLAFDGASLASLKFLMVAFMALSLIVGLLPLTLLFPKLAQVRRAGLIEYGRMANAYTRSFDQKWVHPAEPTSEPLLGSSDIQSLADLGNSFGIIRDMTVVPITRKLAIQLVVQAGAPIIPVILVVTPVGTIVDAVLKMVL